MATGTGNLPNQSMSFSPFAILTAEEMNDLVENIESLADASGIGDGAIDTTQLADDAVTSAKIDFGTLTAPVYAFDSSIRTTTSTSYTTLTGAPSVTMVVPASGKVKVTIGNQSLNSTGGSVQTKMSFAMSGANTLASADGNSVTVTYTGYITGTRVIFLDSLTPGSTTFTIQCSVAGGTGSYARQMIMVEPIYT